MGEATLVPQMVCVSECQKLYYPKYTAQQMVYLRKDIRPRSFLKKIMRSIGNVSTKRYMHIM